MHLEGEKLAGMEEAIFIPPTPGLDHSVIENTNDNQQKLFLLFKQF
jgi:hypothetical protein